MKIVFLRYTEEAESEEIIVDDVSLYLNHLRNKGIVNIAGVTYQYANLQLSSEQLSIYLTSDKHM